MRMRIVLTDKLEEGAEEEQIETCWLPDGMVNPPAGMITLRGENFHIIGFLWETWEGEQFVSDPDPKVITGHMEPAKYLGAKLIVMNRENAQKFHVQMQRQQAGAKPPLIIPAGGGHHQPFGRPNGNG